MPSAPKRAAIGPDEFVWAPEVHSAFGESLRFYFARTAYSARTHEEFATIVDGCSHAVTGYEIFGQFDFLVRSWGTKRENEHLHSKLVEFGRKYLGNCFSVEATDVFYAWAAATPPSPEDVRDFQLKLSRMCANEVTQYIGMNEKSLREKRILLDGVAARLERQVGTLKAFSVVRNVALSPASFDLLNMSLRSWLREHAVDQDASLYKTKGDFDFIVRWSAPSFPELATQILELIKAVEADGATAIFETYFVARPAGPTRENFRLMPRVGGVAQNREGGLSGWYKVLPALGRVSKDRRDYFLSVCEVPEVGLRPAEVEADKQLRGLVESFLAEASDDFAARVMAFYSNFESRLRSEILRALWRPLPEEQRQKQLEKWAQVLGRATPIPVGSDAGERVPKLTLGDSYRIMQAEYGGLFNQQMVQVLDQLIAMRNKLGHFGTEALRLHDFETVLRQARVCSAVLGELKSRESAQQKHTV